MASFLSTRAKGVARSGSHSPLVDRQARLPGGERANIRAKREIQGTWRDSIALRPKLCYNKIRKAVEIWLKRKKEAQSGEFLKMQEHILTLIMMMILKPNTLFYIGLR